LIFCFIGSASRIKNPRQIAVAIQMETLNNSNTSETKNHNNNMMHKIVVLVIPKQHKKHNVFLHFNIAKTFVSVFCGYVISRHEKRITIDIEIFIAVANCT
jgi:hypothetical protein